MKSILGTIAKVGVSALSAAMPLIAAAQRGTPPPATVLAPTPTETGISTAGSFFTAIVCGMIVNWMFYILVVLVVVFIIVAAFKYLTASGDPEKVKSANHSLIYAVVALVVAILARSVPTIVSSIFLPGGGFSC